MIDYETKLLKIGELAKQVRENNSTIRYWTKQGLLEVAEVTEAGYQLYDSDMIKRVEQIHAMKKKAFGHCKRLEKSFMRGVTNSSYSLKRGRRSEGGKRPPQGPHRRQPNEKSFMYSSKKSSNTECLYNCLDNLLYPIPLVFVKHLYRFSFRIGRYRRSLNVGWPFQSWGPAVR